MLFNPPLSHAHRFFAFSSFPKPVPECRTHSTCVQIQSKPSQRAKVSRCMIHDWVQLIQEDNLVLRRRFKSFVKYLPMHQCFERKYHLWKITPEKAQCYSCETFSFQRATWSEARVYSSNQV